MRKGEETRNRVADAAGVLFQRRGFHGVGMADVIEASGAPKGSVYFHFRGGKDELGVAAVERAAERFGDGIERVFAAAPTAADGVDRVCAGMAASLEHTDFELGCPIATVALETAAASPQLAGACAAGFERWLAAIGAGLERDGHLAGDAGELAVLVLSALEGALILARASRDTGPIHRVAARLRPLLERKDPCDS